MKESKLNEIPTHFLNVVETTSEANGYPKNLEFAVYGFDTFEDAKAFADENELDLVWLHQRDGQQLPNRIGTAYEPLKITCDTFGDNYAFYDNAEEFSDAARDTIAEMVKSSRSIYDIRSYLDDAADILDEINAKDDGEVVVVRDGRYFRTQELNPISFSFDTHTTFLAAI